MTAPMCPGCGLSSDGREVLCGVCWSAVPAAHRAVVRKAQRAVGYNPASARARSRLELAIASAVGASR